MAKNHNLTNLVSRELSTQTRIASKPLRPGKTARDRANGAQQRLMQNREQRAPRQPKKDRTISDFRDDSDDTFNTHR